MSELVKVVVDAMGGDYAPEVPVKGAVDALNERKEIFVYLAGRKEMVEEVESEEPEKVSRKKKRKKRKK